MSLQRILFYWGDYMKEDIKVIFGENIRKYREFNKFTQEYLGELSKLHSTYISDIERGRRNVSLESIQKLARALDIEVYKLFIS